MSNDAGGRADDADGQADDFAALMASLDPAMAIVTSAIDGERSGCLVGFHAQCSIDPNRYAVWLSKANRTYRVALFSEALAVHFPARHDRDLAELFGANTGDELDKFDRCEWQTGFGGVPLLDRLPNRLVGPRGAVLDDGGDHVCMVVEGAQVHVTGPFTPLRLSDVRDLEAGHAVGDRPVPPTLAAPTSH
jgi:flavin reductase (DIM6/NTAB) family NADH-FMN oxidoreductase RutF